MKFAWHVAPVIVGLGLAFSVGSVLSAEGPDLSAVKPAARDGFVSEKEAAHATDLVVSDPSAELILNGYAGKLTAWQPVEIEGVESGAYAEIVLPAPTHIGRPVVIRATNREMAEGSPAKAADGTLLSAKGYVLERSELVGTDVERYMVFVDLETDRIVYLAPMAPPPVTSPAPEDYKPNVQPNHAVSSEYLGGE